MDNVQSYIYNYINEADIKELLKAFYHCTGLFTQLMDDTGRTILAFGQSAHYCNEFRRYLPKGETCAGEHFKASKRAIEFGESYIFCCHSGLYHIVYPLITKTTMLGSVIVGPFLMEEPDSDLILDLEKKYEIPTAALIRLSEYSHELKLVKPETTTEISRLLYHLLNSLVTGSRELQSRNHEKLLQQSKINETIQMYKSSGMKERMPYPIEKEKRLVELVRSGDIKTAREAFNDMLASLIIYDNYSPDDIKFRIIEISTLLSRAAIDKGANAESILDMNKRLVSDLQSCNSIEDIGYVFQDNMDIFTDSLFYSSEIDSHMVRKVTQYIADHYSEHVTLTDLAERFHINQNRLSNVFTLVTGQSFNEYLNRVRVEQAKRLLTDTDYPILDVAIACGFNDQSYFTKVFKKNTGFTPKNFR
ncbi:MAG: PocR ligand-binding domain-containing protein [Lachnospiraceae bacterium]|nr:PocR ligand-binding domain-containing protein [Lachnospiraceae bacterium]